MDYKFFIGIDVSKNTLDFTVLKDKELLLQYRGSNDVSGIKLFWDQLRSQKDFHLKQVLFCMEHTGIYNQHLLQELYAKGAAICLQSSVHIKLSAGLQRGKNDKIDSLRIAQYAYKNRHELKLWQPKRQIIEQLKHLTGLRTRLLNAKKQLSTALGELTCFDAGSAKDVKQLCGTSLKALKDDIKKVEDQLDQVIISDAYLKRLFKIITSIKGIGKITAAEMIVCSNEFKDITEPKKFACYAGIAPFEHSSGSSIRQRTRVSHYANKTMKTLLHMSAIVAITYNEELRTYYQRKVAENKNKMLVINAVRNKLIWRVFSCVKANREYENNYQRFLHKP